MPNTSPSFARSFEDLLQECGLESFVPLEPFEQYLDDTFSSEISHSDDDVLSRIPRRRLFLTDELFDLHVALRVPFDSEEAVHSFLSHLTINVATHVEYAQGKLRDGINTGHATRDISQRCIFSSAVTIKDKVRLLRTKGSSYIFWKENCHLGLPKDFSENFHVYFVTTATRNNSNKLSYYGNEEECLRSGIPLPSNVLQPLSHDPALENIRPYLSALRFTKITPSISGDRNYPKPIVLKSKTYPVLRILGTKYRVISCNKIRAKQIMLLSIEVKASTVLNTEVRLVKVDLFFSSGVARQRTQFLSTEQPLNLKPGDQTSLLYEVIMDDINDNNNDKWPIARICKGNIVALVDISTERSTKVLIDCRDAMYDAFQKATAELLVEPSSNVLIKPSFSHEDYQNNSSLSHPFHDQGIAISVSGPQEVRWGEVFVWNILIVNKTRAARRCFVTLLHHDMKKCSEERESKTHPTVGRINQEISIRPMAQENTAAFDLLLSQRKAIVKRTSILCLSPEIRIDPLLPLGCFATKFELLPLQLGRCHAGALQVTDELSKEFSVIETLPEVIVTEPK